MEKGALTVRGITLLTTLTLLLGALGPGLGPGGDGWDASGESGAPTYRPLQDRWVTNQWWFINSTDDVVHQNKTIRATQGIFIMGNLTLENVQLRCTGDIIIVGGTLTLKNSALREAGNILAFNGSFVNIHDSAVLMYSWQVQEPLEFNIGRGANLTVDNSLLTETIVVQNDQDERPNNPLYWKFIVNGTTRIDDSEVSYLWGDLSGYQLPTRGRTSMTALGGIQILYDDVVITNTTVRKSQSSGIFMDGTSPLVSGCNITENIGYGFSAIGGAPEISNCYIAYNGYHGGIIGDSGGTYVHNNTIAHNGWMGAIISNSTAIVENNHLYGNDYGFWIVSGGDSVVRHNTINETFLAFDIWWGNTEIYGNTVSGLQESWETAFAQAYLLEGDIPGGYGGSAVIRDNTIDNFTYALAGSNVRDLTFRDNEVGNVLTGFTMWNCTGDDLILENNSINNLQSAFYLTGSPDVVSLNNQFTWKGTQYDPWGYEEDEGIPSSSLWMKWYADVMVLDQNDLPVSGATVAVTDRDDNSVFSGQTAGNGKTAMFLATDYWQNETQTDPHNPHHFLASKGSDSDSHTEAINGTETVTLQWPSIQQGDWVVTTTEKHSDDLKLLQGDLLVKSGGALYLTDYVLKMANTLSTAYTIEVEYGGKIVFENASVFSNLAAVDHTWDIAGEAYIRNSTLKDIEGGLHVISDDVLISSVTVDATGMDAGIVLDYSAPMMDNSAITDSDGGGLVITGALGDPGWIETLTLSDNLYGIIADGVIGWIGIEDCNLSGNGVGAYVTNGGELWLDHCAIYSNGDGVLVDEGANVSLWKCDISYNTGDGISAFTGNVYAVNNEIHHNGDDGIELTQLSGFPVPMQYQYYFSKSFRVTHYGTDVRDNTFYANADKHLAVTDSLGVLSWSNSFSGAAFGIWADSSSVLSFHDTFDGPDKAIYFRDCNRTAAAINATIVNSTYGMQFYNSGGLVLNSSLSNNDYAVSLLSGSDPKITNSSITGSNNEDFQLSGNSHPFVHNTTFNILAVDFLDASSSLDVGWHLDVGAEDAAQNAVQGAQVVVKDSTSTVVHNKTTDMYGYVRDLECVHTSYTDTDNNGILEVNGRTPHNVTVTAPGYDPSYANPNMNDDKEVVVTLTGNSAPSTPSNIQPTSSHDPGPTITWTASTDPEGDPVTYHIDIWKGSTSGPHLVVDEETSGTSYDLDFDLVHGNSYHIEVWAADDRGGESTPGEGTLDVVNADPVLATVGKKIAYVDVELKFTLVATDTDTNPTDTITYDSNVTGMFDSLNESSGEVSWTPALEDVGVHYVRFSASDEWGGEDGENTTITVMGQAVDNLPPVADAGDDKGVALDSVVHLNASGSNDPDGNVTGWNWTLDSGPSFPTLYDDTTEEAHFTPDAEGDYVFFLKVQDDLGAWSLTADTVTITAAANTPPIANISSPDDGSEWGNQTDIPFNGNTSYDPDDDVNGNGTIDGNETNNITSYTWWIVDQANASNSTKFTNDVFSQILAVGNYTISLVVSDGVLDSNNATVSIEVITQVNRPPIAVITKPADNSTGAGSSTWEFDATGSTDPDGDNLTFNWRYAEDGGTLTTLMDDAAEFESRLPVGDVTINLTVSDSEYAAFAEAVVHVTNTDPIAMAHINTTSINPNNEVKLKADGSYDPDDDWDGNGTVYGFEDDNLTYSWDFDDTIDDNGDGDMANDSEASGPSITHRFLEGGNYTITLTVTDLHGGVATDTVSLKVNRPPIARAGIDQEVEIGDTVYFEGSASNPDGDSLSYSWDFDAPGDGVFGNVDSDRKSAQTSYSIARTYWVTLKVGDGLATDTDSLMVTVIETEEGNAPVAMIEAPEGVVNIDVEVNFTANGSYDPDDDENSNEVIDGTETDRLPESGFEWYFGGSDDGDPDGTGREVSWEFGEAGEYNVTLNITDSTGLFGNYSVTIKVNARPVADFWGPDEALVNTEVTFDAENSTDDDDDDIIQYRWNFGDEDDDDFEETDDDTITHTYSETGDYEVKLWVQDENEVWSEEEVSYKIEILERERGVPTITSPKDGDTITKKTLDFSGKYVGNVELITLKITGDGTKTIEVNGNDLSSGSWSATWTVTEEDNGEYSVEIKAEYPNGDLEDGEDKVDFTIDVTDAEDGEDGGDEPAADEEDGLLGLGKVAGIDVLYILLIVVIVLILLIAAGASSSKKARQQEARRRRRRMEMRRRAEADARTRAAAAAGGGDDGDEEGDEKDMEEDEEALEQVIKCPRCKEVFLAEDDGSRPLKTRCPNCRAVGMLRDLPPREELIPPSVTIKCPNCTKMFKTDQEEKLTCPHCGLTGAVPEAARERLADLKDNWRAKGGAAGLRDTPERHGAGDEEEEEEEEDEDITVRIGGRGAGEDASGLDLRSVQCPDCSFVFTIKPDATSIKCPTCGLDGELG